MTTSLICASHSPLLYCYAREPEDWDGLQRAFAERAQAVSEFDPELVVAFGSDHFNGFFLKTMPAFCVGINAEASRRYRRVCRTGERAGGNSCCLRRVFAQQ